MPSNNIHDTEENHHQLMQTLMINSTASSCSRLWDSDNCSRNTAFDSGLSQNNDFEPGVSSMLLR